MIPALLAVQLALSANASETLVVLSEDQPVYREALAGFSETFATPFEVRLATSDAELPADARVVVAIGGRAALRNWPPEVAVVVCLAPAARGPLREGPTSEVSMLPPPSILLRRLRLTAPRLASVGVLWSAEGFAPYMRELARSDDPRVLVRRVDSAADLLDALRSLRGLVDAIWLPPDPLLAEPERLRALQAALNEWGVPFYGATPGFTRYGATAIVGASFSDVGAAAARAARDALDGRLARRYYPLAPVTVGRQP